MATLFTQIINGEIPAHIVAEDEGHIAFLDIRPITLGHTLVVPKQEVAYLFHMTTCSRQALMAFAQRVAESMEKVIPCQRIGMLVLGLEVPHVHLHLVPLHDLQTIHLSRQKAKLASREMAQIAEQIKEGISSDKRCN